MDKATRERIRQQANEVRAAKQQAQVPLPSVSILDSPKVPSKKPKIVETKPTGVPPRVILFACGHAAGNHDCGACRKKARLDKNLRRRTVIAQKKNDDSQRLPDGAEFHVAYNAEAKLWSGVLSINGADITGQANGVFRLLQTLDAKYRESLNGDESGSAT